MSAPWNRPPRHVNFGQTNSAPPFPGRQNYSLRPNNLQEGVTRPTRPYSPIRNGAPRQFQGFRPEPPQIHNMQRGPVPRGNFQLPPPPMMPPASQFPRQQAIPALINENESMGYQFNNENPQTISPAQRFKTEQQISTFIHNEAFFDSALPPPSFNQSSHHQHPQQLEHGEFHGDYKPHQGLPSSLLGGHEVTSMSRVPEDSEKDSERPSAAAWVMNWLRHRKRQEKQGEVKQPITICEAQEKTRQMIVLLAKLLQQKQQLASMQHEDRTIWEQKLREVTKTKCEFDALHQTLTSEETVAELGKKIRQRQSKRRRLKRLRLEQYTKDQEETALREQKHRKMDRLLEQVKLKHEQQKQEEAMKKEGDQILGEVKKKMSEATKAVQLIEGLQKLRKLRVDRLERQGVFGQIQGFGGGSSHQVKFEETVSGMSSLLNDQLHTYRSEEGVLKVILETEQEETRGKEREKQMKKQEEQRVREQRREEQRLFGDQKEARPGDPLYPFAQYYKAAENSLDALISIRHDWDMHMVLPETPGASQIPRCWIHPVEPSSDVWASALMDKT